MGTVTELIKDNPRYHVRVVGIDPGIRNLFHCYGADGTQCHMRQGEFRALAKQGAYTDQLAKAVEDAKKNRGLPDLPSSHHRPDLEAILDRAAVLNSHAAEFESVYNSTHQRHWRVAARNCIKTRPHAVISKHAWVESERVIQNTPIRLKINRLAQFRALCCCNGHVRMRRARLSACVPIQGLCTVRQPAWPAAATMRQRLAPARVRALRDYLALRHRIGRAQCRRGPGVGLDLTLSILRRDQF